MSIMQIIGAGIIVLFFLAIAAVVSVIEQRWWVGPALIGLALVITAIVVFAVYLMIGGGNG